MAEVRTSFELVLKRCLLLIAESYCSVNKLSDFGLKDSGLSFGELKILSTPRR